MNSRHFHRQLLEIIDGELAQDGQATNESPKALAWVFERIDQVRTPQDVKALRAELVSALQNVGAENAVACPPAVWLGEAECS